MSGDGPPSSASARGDAAKRPRADDIAAGLRPAPDVVDLDDDPYAQFRRELLAHVNNLQKATMAHVDNLQKATMDSTVALVRATDTKYEKRCNTLEQELAALRADQDRQEKEQQELKTQVDKMQQALAVAEATVPIKDTLGFPEFNRLVDSTILRINIPDIDSRVEVTKAFQPWLSEAGCDSDAQVAVLGPDTSRRFVVQFKGSAGLAENRLRKARGLLRSVAGEWRQFPVPIQDHRWTHIYRHLRRHRQKPLSTET